MSGYLGMPLLNGKTVEWLLRVMEVMELRGIKDGNQLADRLDAQRARAPWDWSGY